MLKSAQTPRRPDRETAETIAAQGLAFLAAEPHRLSRFLAVTGLEPGDLKARAATREVLAAVLSFVADDESLLLTLGASGNLATGGFVPVMAVLLIVSGHIDILAR